MQRVEVAPFQMIGISVRTTNVDGQEAKDIGAMWARFMSEGLLEKIPHKVDKTIYSLYTEYEGDHTKPYTVILGCKVSSLQEIPEGMIGQAFGGGSYYKITSNGDIMKGFVSSQWKEIWDLGLDRAYTADFEVYGEKAQNPNDAEIDFYISVL